VRRVLVTGACGPAGSSIGRQLVERGHSVIGVDSLPVEYGAFPIATVLPADDPAFVDMLFDYASRWNVDLIVPTVTEELTIPALHGEFPDWRIVIGPLPGVQIANDKWLTANALLAAGVAVPRSALTSPQTESDQATLTTLFDAGVQMVSKPRVGRGGRDVIVHADSTEVLSASPGRIVQEFAPGTEYAVDLLVPDDSERADVVGVLEKTQLAQGLTGNGVTVRRLPHEAVDDVVELARSAVRAVGLTGPVDVDVRRRADGTPAVLEINARLGAHSAHVPEICDGILASFRVREAR
jgi:predicted ATP-grasp superfamily ATP-dependent carboligase